MSAEKARPIRRIYMPRNDGFVVAEIEVDGGSTTVNLNDLKRPELIRGAALVGAKPPEGENWSGLSNGQLIHRIIEKVRADGDYVPTGGDRGGDAKSKAEGRGEGGNSGAEGQGEGEGTGEGEQGSPDGDPEGQGEGEGDGEFEPEPFIPDPKDEPAEGDSIEEKIEKLKRQAEAEAKHKAEQEKAEEAFNKAKAEAEAAAEAAEKARKEAEKEQQVSKRKLRNDLKKLLEAIPEGSHEVMSALITALHLGQHVWLTGPPGTGKSTASQLAAEILGRTYGAMSCGPTMPESQLRGFITADGSYSSTEFRRQYESDDSLFTLDEGDNGHPGILTVLNQALSGSGMNFPDRWVDVGDRFNCVVTANTWGSGATAEHMGRQAQDAAFLDRFTFLEVNIDAKVERAMVRKWLGEADTDAWLNVIHQLRSNAEERRIHCVVSPRAAEGGAALLAAGWDRQQVVDARVLKGLSEDRRATLTQGVRGIK